MIKIYFWHSRPNGDDPLVIKLKNIAEDRGDYFLYSNASLDAFARDIGRMFMVCKMEPGRHYFEVFVTQFGSFSMR